MSLRRFVLSVSLALTILPPAGAEEKLPPNALVRIGQPRLRHTASVISTAFSPDGKLVASVGNDNLIRLWDPKTGKEVRQLAGHDAGVQSVAFSPDSKTLVTGSHDQTLRLWDVATGKEVQKFIGHNDIVLPVAFSPDGKHVASESRDATVKIWDAKTGKELQSLEGHRSQGTSNLAFSPDGKTLASVGADFAVRLWDVAAGKELKKLEGHTGDINSLDFSADGKMIGSASTDKTIKLWDVATGKELQTLKGHENIGATVRFAPDGKTVVTGSVDRTIRVWDVATGKELKKMVGHTSIVSEVSVSPDGKMVASAGHDGTLRLWDIATGKELPQSGGLVACAAVSPDGKALATGADDGTIRFWEPATGKRLDQVIETKHPVTALAYASDGKLLVSGLLGGEIIFWDPATGKELRRCDGVPKGRVHSLALSDNGKVLVSLGDDAAVRLWDATTGKANEHAFITEAAKQGVPAVFALHPDGKLLALGDTASPRVQLVDTETGKEVRGIEAPNVEVNSLSFSRNGRTLAIHHSDEVVRLYETTTGQPRGEFRPGDGFGVATMAFSPEGRMVIVGSGDRLVVARDIATDKELAQLDGHKGAIHSLAPSGDGKLLVSIGEDATAVVWDLARLRKGMKLLKGKLTPGELETLWSDLGSEEGKKAHAALWKLAAAPDTAVKLLEERLPRKDVKEDPERIQKLIVQLDDDDFAVREKATETLARLGKQAEKLLKEAYEKTRSLEVRRRVEQILDKLKGGPGTPEGLRVSRGVEALETIGSPEAKKLLETLAKGPPEMTVTAEAKAALERWQARPSP